LANLPFGDYYLIANVSTAASFTDDPRRKPRSTPRVAYVRTFYPGTTEMADAEVVSVRNGEPFLSVDFSIHTVRLARVSGRLIAWSGTFHDGTHVALAPTRARGRGANQEFIGVSRVTSDGSFFIDAVPPGEYVLQARSVPLSSVNAVASTGRTDAITESDTAEFGTARLFIDGEDIVDLAVTMVRAGQVSGQVVLDGRPFRPRDPSKVVATAIPVDPDSFSGGAREEVIDRTGNFVIRGLVGEFVLRVRGLPKGVSFSRVEAGGADVTDLGVSVGGGQDFSDLAIVLTSQPSVLTGRVVPVRKVALQKTAVHVFSQESRQWELAATRYVAVARPDVDGAFQVRGLPPGRYFAVALDKPSTRPVDAAVLATLAKMATRVTIREGPNESLRLELQRTPDLLLDDPLLP
jgi:hypothetical protein